MGTRDREICNGATVLFFLLETFRYTGPPVILKKENSITRFRFPMNIDRPDAKRDKGYAQEIMLWRFFEILREFGRALGSLEEFCGFWESLGEFGRFWESLGEFWES